MDGGSPAALYAVAAPGDRLDALASMSVGAVALEGDLIALTLVLARLGPAIWLLPFPGGRLMPSVVKSGLSLALAVVMLPAAQPLASIVAVRPIGFVLALVVKEAFVGVALGFLGAQVFYGAQAAGWLVDTMRGASMSEVMVAQQEASTTATGALMFQLAIVLFLAVGGHRLWLMALGRSYVALPIDAFLGEAGTRSLAWLAIRLSTELLLVAVGLAAPVIIALLLADVTLGWISRFVSQVNVFFIAMPLKALLGIAMLVLVLVPMLTLLPEMLSWAVRGVDAGVTALSGG